MEPSAIRSLRESDRAWITAAFAVVGWSKPRELYERYRAEQEAGQRQVWIACTRDQLAG